MKSPDIAGYLEDILDNARQAKAFVGEMSFEEVAADTKTVRAVERALEIIGEATKRLPQAFRQRYPEIPWKPMAGMRDVVSHQYRAVELDVLYRTATEDMTILIDRLPAIIAETRAFD